MRVAITLNTAWNIYNFRSGLIRGLQNAGHEVLAIAPRDDYVHQLEALGCTFLPIPVDNTGTHPVKDLRLLYQLLQLYRRHRPDIVYHYTIKPNIYGAFAARWFGIPAINNVSGLGTAFLARGFSSRIARWLYRWSFRYASVVFFQNADDRQIFLSRVHSPRLKTALLPGSGIDLSRFMPAQSPPTSPAIFLMVARLIVEKGVLEFLEAAEKVKQACPDAVFQLLGRRESTHARGISQTQLEKYTQSGVVHYLGEVEDVRPFFAASSCVVLPSYREGLSRTLLEAAAMAKPIIATDVPGCREVVIDQKSGYLCQPKSVTDLADKMKSVYLKSALTLEKMGMAGRKLVEEQFDEQIVVRQYLEYTDVLLRESPVS